jgi:hypothetical protein
MEIKVTRRWGGENSTLSTVRVDGVVQQFILEDVDRGLRQAQSDKAIAKVKIKGKTAIPTGRYRIDITYSNRFKRLLPILLNVPGFTGIRIHPGNRHVNTDGCLLPGKTWWKEDDDFVVGTSRTASEDLQFKINNALKRGEEVWCTILTDSAYKPYEG